MILGTSVFQRNGWIVIFAEERFLVGGERSAMDGWMDGWKKEKYVPVPSIDTPSINQSKHPSQTLHQPGNLNISPLENPIDHERSSPL